MLSLNKRIVIRSFIATSLILLGFIIDPLGVRNSAEQHYEDHILRLWSPFYSSAVSSNVTVVLIDDAFVEATEKYPVSYRNLSRILKGISAHSPDRVFFDILQIHEHSPNVNYWLKTIDSRDFPVYMASIPEYDTEFRLRNNSLRKNLNEVSEFTAVSWSNEGRYYPLRVNWNDSKMKTAAYSLYLDWCSKTSVCNLNDVKDWNDSIIVQWSNKYFSEQESLFPLQGDCGNQPGGQWSQAIELMFISLFQGLHSDATLDNKLRRKCPPFPTISVSKLLDQGSINSAELRKVIEGRTILVGYHLTGSSDLVVSPVHGTLPGVMFHAMALDNLISHGDEYWHVPSDTGIFKLNVVDIIEISVQTVVLFFVIYFRFNTLENTSSNLLTTKEKLIRALIPSVTILIFILVSVFVSQFLLNVGISNWYGLLFIIFLDLPIFFYQLFEAVRPYVDRKLAEIRGKLSISTAK